MAYGVQVPETVLLHLVYTYMVVAVGFYACSGV